MRELLVVAGQEMRDGVRNRWVVAATLVLAALALALAFLGTAPTGTLGASPLAVTVVSLASLSIFLLPLIALLLSYDAVVGAHERGTLLLLLAYPVARWQFVVGTFLGHLALLAVATVLGYGAAAVALVLVRGAAGAAEWTAFAGLVGSAVLLGAVFLALGYLVSALARERGTAAGLAVALWLVFVLIFDLALLGALVAGGDAWLTPNAVALLLLSNPADAFRLFNLAGSETVAQFSGMAGLADQVALTPAAALAALAAWTAVPLALAVLAVARRAI